jgi:hypothetical protein
MAIDGNLEYAATRVQAQHGTLPRDVDWQGLEASQDVGHYLDSARTGPLAPWVASLDAHQELHVLERSLRTQWRSHVERVASWHPQAWQPWLRWLAWLPTLPLLAPLARGATLPMWLMSDAALAGSPSPAARAALVPLGEHVSIAVLWRRRWDGLVPQTDADTRAHLRQLLDTIDRHAGALAGGTATLTLRRHLQQRLELLFRLSAGTAIATACQLGSLALSLERLRGGLAQRCLLGPLRDPAR